VLVCVIKWTTAPRFRLQHLVSLLLLTQCLLGCYGCKNIISDTINFVSSILIICHFLEKSSRRPDIQISTWTHKHTRCWVKRDQLDATCFIITLFRAQHVSDVSTSILRSLRLIRWVTSWVVSGSKCVGVTLQCGRGGVVSVCRLRH